MNVLVLGNGGRENAIARKAKNSRHVEKVFVVPGNSGMDSNLIINSSINSEDFIELEKYCKIEQIKLIIVGNESYLEKGVVDYFDKTDIKIFGPTKAGANIETSKDFAKDIMNKYNVPTAGHNTFNNEKDALEFLDKQTFPIVIKQDGLALGKGVLVSSDFEEAKQFIIDSFQTNDKLIFEEFLDGPEFSLLCFVNDDKFIPMQPAKDYKRAFDGDKGLNTGGMGCFTPVPFVSDDDLEFCYKEIIQKTVNGLKEEGISYKGILYAGLIKTDEGIKVIEFNARFGDPETEVLMEAMESDIIEVILSILDSNEIEISWKDGATVGVCLASKGYPQEYKKNEEIIINGDVNYYSMAIKRDNGKYYNNGGRVVFVYGSGENVVVVVVVVGNVGVTR